MANDAEPVPRAPRQYLRPLSPLTGIPRTVWRLPKRKLRRFRKDADRQFSLARGSIEWARAHTVSVDDLAEPLRVAEQALAETGPTDPFWSSIDTDLGGGARACAGARTGARTSESDPSSRSRRKCRGSLARRAVRSAVSIGTNWPGTPEGLAHQLADQRTKGTPDESGERELLRWRQRVAVGDLRQAAEGLTRLDERLRAGRSELALREFPRGLTDYVPRGSRGMRGGVRTTPSEIAS